MFDARLPLLLRLISLFHVLLPIVWVLLLVRWGYDRRALRLQVVALCIVVAVTYAFTGPDLNINWVYLPYKLRLSWLPEDAWLVAYVVLVPLLVYWPLHWLYSRVLPQAA